MKSTDILKSVTKPSRLIVTGILLFLPTLLAMVLVIWGNWEALKPSFVKITFVDVLDLYTSLALALFLATLVTRRLHDETRRREILLQMFERMQQLSEQCLDGSMTYIGDRSISSQKRVTRLFRESGSFLSAIKQCAEDHHGLFYSGELHAAFVRFKKAATDTPFGQVGHASSEEEELAIQDAYSELRDRIYTHKLHLFK